MNRYFMMYWDKFLLGLGYDIEAHRGREGWYIYKRGDWELGLEDLSNFDEMNVIIQKWNEEKGEYDVYASMTIKNEARADLERVLQAIARPKEIPLCVGISWAADIVEEFLHA